MAKLNRRRLEGLSERLRALIDNSGLTYVELAKRMGIHRHTLCSYREGDVQPDSYTLARFCLVFHVSADYLLFGKCE